MRFIKREHLLEIVIALVYMAIIWWFMKSTEAYEYLYDFTRRHEHWELDEVVLSFPIVLIAVTWFAIRGKKALRKTIHEKNKINAQLREANTRIQELTKAREQFVAIAHHEMSNSLSSVISAIHLIDPSRPNKDIQKSIDQAKVLSLGLKQYSSDILDVIRYILKDIKGKPERFDIQHVFEEATCAARFKANLKDLEFSLDFDPTLPPIQHGYPKLLRHIVQNLADNSVKYTHEGTIHVYCGKSETEGNALCIQVSDTGQGITRTAQKAIFEPYKKGQNDKATEGIGLGLFVVRRLVEELKGRISVKDNTPQGSVFTVVAPLQAPE